MSERDCSCQLLLAKPGQFDNPLSIGPLEARLVLREAGVIPRLAKGTAMDLHVGRGVDEEVAAAGDVSGGGVALHVLCAAGEGRVDPGLLLHGHGARAPRRCRHHLLALLTGPAGQRGIHAVEEAHVVDVVAEVGDPTSPDAWRGEGVAAGVQGVQGAVTCTPRNIYYLNYSCF